MNQTYRNFGLWDQAQRVLGLQASVDIAQAAGVQDTLEMYTANIIHWSERLGASKVTLARYVFEHHQEYGDPQTDPDDRFGYEDLLRIGDLGYWDYIQDGGVLNYALWSEYEDLFWDDPAEGERWLSLFLYYQNPAWMANHE